MKVGFTGSQRGMNSRQIHNLMSWLRANDVDEFHHGSCIGADTAANYCAAECGIPIIIHLPIDTEKMSNLREFATEIRSPLPYLDRNHMIVNECNMLIAAPIDPEKEELRSGTWATIRYARKKGIPVLILDNMKVMDNGTT